MVKHFNIIMAGVISGIVALFTSVLGVSGTVIGSVLSSFLYQLLSAYYEEKTKNVDFSDSKFRKNKNSKKLDSDYNHKLAHNIAFIFPLVVIILIECVFCLTSVHYGFLQIFNILEAATDQNLFRVMGIGLILLGFYPLFKPKIVKRINGSILIFAGILLFLRGIIDSHPLLIMIYDKILYHFDLGLSLLIILLLIIVIVNVLRKSNIKSEDNKVNSYSPRKVGADFNNFDSQNYNPNTDYNRNHNESYTMRNSNIPIYEEDFIYVTDPNNPNRTVKKKILKKISDGSSGSEFNRPKRR